MSVGEDGKKLEDSRLLGETTAVDGGGSGERGDVTLQ
jgi:hypothetical protein